MTGVPGLDDAPAELSRALRSQIDIDTLVVAGDVLTTHVGSLAHEPGVVVAAGTGAIALGTDFENVWRRADGWGYALGDDGGGAWIGGHGLKAALRAHDGREGGSAALLSQLRAAYGDTAKLVAYVYDVPSPAHVLAQFAPAVAFGIAFPAMVLFMEGLYLRTGDQLYRAIAKRWSKVMLILFAVGVVTGTILSFELGLLWPRFMERFAEVFGMAFALEGVSFFVEAIFIAIYVYGWDRLGRRAHLLAGIPIIIAGMTGSLMVIGVNGWMNDPGGFEIDGAGNVTNVNPFAAFVNSNVWHETVHMYVAGVIVAGFIVAGIYAFGWLRGRRDRFHRAAMIVPLAFACLASPVQIIVGDWAARTVAETQPVKLAAFEGLEETTDGADLSLGGIMIGDEIYGALSIPNGLSLLAHHDPAATVEGLDTVAVDDRPPVPVVRNAFQLMVSIGMALAVLSAVFLITCAIRGRLPRSRLFYAGVVAAGPAALVALISGWIVTEVGRQPWIVYEIMRVEEAVTGADGIPVGYATLALVYLGLALIVLFLLRRLSRRPIEDETADTGGPTGEGARP